MSINREDVNLVFVCLTLPGKPGRERCVTPDGKEHPLNYWDVISPGLSSLGSKAEWWVVKQKGRVIPLALIVRVNAREGAESRKAISYLAVAKITPQAICVTESGGCFVFSEFAQD